MADYRTPRGNNPLPRSLQTRCRFGFGMRWACRQPATQRVTSGFGAKDEYCDAHAGQIEGTAEPLPKVAD